MAKKVITKKVMGDFLKLADLKKKLKDIEADISVLQKKLIAGGYGDVELTSVGLLRYCERTYYSMDNEIVATVIGKNFYIKHSSISTTGIIEAGGEAALNKIDKKGGRTVKSVSKYYQLIQKKGGK